MSGLLPSNSDVEAGGGEPRVIGVDSDDADRLLAALSSATARNLLAALHDEPATPSELAEVVDTSLQNVQYHLGKLRDAELIEVRGTEYSEKGREMNVYGPVDRPLVVYAGTEEQTAGVKSALTRLLGAVGVLGVGSLLVQQLLGDDLRVPGAPAGGDGGPSVAEVTTSQPPAAGGGVNFTGPELTTEAAAAQTAVPPGLLFLAGGLLVLALGVAWWRFRGN